MHSTLDVLMSMNCDSAMSWPRSEKRVGHAQFVKIKNLSDQKTWLNSPSISNVTKRNKKQATNINFFTSTSLNKDEDLNSLSSSLSTSNCRKLNRSCPETGMDLHGEIKALNHKIIGLQDKLPIAEQEIENLVIGKQNIKY